MVICKYCLNPSYKDQLCVEHYDKKEVWKGPHTFVISGDKTLFERVKAFRVYKTADKNVYEIRLKGHAVNDFPKIKTLVNTHFKGADLYVEFTIPDNKFRFYHLIYHEYKKRKVFYADARQLWQATMTINGIHFRIEDTGYHNIIEWEQLIKDEISSVLKWCKTVLVKEAIYSLVNFGYESWKGD